MVSVLFPDNLQIRTRRWTDNSIHLVREYTNESLASKVVNYSHAHYTTIAACTHHNWINHPIAGALKIIVFLITIFIEYKIITRLKVSNQPTRCHCIW